MTAQQQIHDLTASVPGFPKPGITFRDLTPVFADPSAFRAVTDELLAPFAGSIDAVAGVEARGFLVASAAAYAAGLGVITIRKAGKLPGRVLAHSYDLEYGTATLEIQPDGLAAGARVLLLDDVLATGGTLGASCELLEEAGCTVAGIGVVLELEGLSGRANLAGRTVHALAALPG
ncbi:adenine phosphoribosyltransferase [Saxibacter everestensis]|uniref:Adenine phosphoribosyltransferase n=1 Tax=Saxibacter everestensis TaxID=2909229 RepID=A0ABY8QVS4_9MICO|nr:adenine phosphoribosyltransferase [Brevibacteriaceae bacterium ZFBP1038]